MTINPSTDRESRRVPVPASNDLEYEALEVWPDEIRIGDIYGGYVVTGIHTADHYRSPAVRLTIYTDPSMLADGTKSEEWGRFVLRTDRETGHKIPIDRPIR
jgi:hypothetical protein